MPIGTQSQQPIGTTPGGGYSPLGTTPGETLINPLQDGGDLESLLQGILAFVVRIGTIVVILMMVFVGFKFVAARGNETKLTEARRMLLWTVIGALILLGAQVIAYGIQATVQSLSVGR